MDKMTVLGEPLFIGRRYKVATGRVATRGGLCTVYRVVARGSGAVLFEDIKAYRATGEAERLEALAPSVEGASLEAFMAEVSADL